MYLQIRHRSAYPRRAMYLRQTSYLDNDIDKLYSEFRSRLIYQVVFWHKTNYVEQLRSTNCVEFIFQKNIFQRSLFSTICFVPKQRFDKSNAYVKTHKLRMSLSYYCFCLLSCCSAWICTAVRIYKPKQLRIFYIKSPNKSIKKAIEGKISKIIA